MSEKIKIYSHQRDIDWGDMDALGHVNNGTYFDYFQEARILALREMDFDLLHEAGPILLNIGCTFLKPVVYPAKITIDVSIHSPGRTSFIMDYDIYQGETKMAEGSSKIVWVNYKAGKSEPLPQLILNYFN